MMLDVPNDLDSQKVVKNNNLINKYLSGPREKSAESEKSFSYESKKLYQNDDAGYVDLLKRAIGGGLIDSENTFLRDDIKSINNYDEFLDLAKHAINAKVLSEADKLALQNKLLSKLSDESKKLYPNELLPKLSDEASEVGMLDFDKASEVGMLDLNKETLKRFDKKNNTLAPNELSPKLAVSIRLNGKAYNEDIDIKSGAPVLVQTSVMEPALTTKEELKKQYEEYLLNLHSDPLNPDSNPDLDVFGSIYRFIYEPNNFFPDNADLCIKVFEKVFKAIIDPKVPVMLGNYGSLIAKDYLTTEGILALEMILKKSFREYLPTDLDLKNMTLALLLRSLAELRHTALHKVYNAKVPSEVGMLRLNEESIKIFNQENPIYDDVNRLLPPNTAMAPTTSATSATSATGSPNRYS